MLWVIIWSMKFKLWYPNAFVLISFWFIILFPKHLSNYSIQLVIQVLAEKSNFNDPFYGFFCSDQIFIVTLAENFLLTSLTTITLLPFDRITVMIDWVNKIIKQKLSFRYVSGVVLTLLWVATRRVCFCN